MMDEKRLIAYCENCGEEITGDSEDVYVDDEGHYFCSLECVLEHYKVTKIEL